MKQMVFGQYVEFVNYKSVPLCIYVTDTWHAGNRGRWLWWYSPRKFAVSTDSRMNPMAVWCPVTFLGCLSHHFWLF